MVLKEIQVEISKPVFYSCEEILGMQFDRETQEMVQKAVAEGQWYLLYTMVPAMDGGQTHEIKCKICGEFGNILARHPVIHAQGCPVDLEEKKREKAEDKNEIS
jgi:hypothetical protein